MKKHWHGWMWISLSVLGVIFLGFIDWITGYDLNFFVFYFLPVSLAAWFVGQGASVSLSILSAIVWFGADVLSGHTNSSQFYAVWNTVVRLSSFLLIGWLVSRIRYLLDRERLLVKELRQVLSEVKAFEAFLPICCQCKKIRNQEGHWQQLEVYINEHAGTKFSHGYCPECAKKVMTEAGLIDKKTESRNGPDEIG
jgi:hypothetical protein